MPGLVPGIHVLVHKKDVDGRDKPGHDEERPFGQALGNGRGEAPVTCRAWNP